VSGRYSLYYFFGSFSLACFLILSFLLVVSWRLGGGITVGGKGNIVLHGNMENINFLT
jgi:hypothetical protein